MKEAQPTVIYIYPSTLLVQLFVGNEKQAVMEGERLQLHDQSIALSVVSPIRHRSCQCDFRINRNR